MVLVPQRDPGRIRWGYQIVLIQLKSDIERSKDKIFFIKYMSAGWTNTKRYLVKVYMEQSKPVAMSNYVKKDEYCSRHPTTECRFWPEIITKN